METVRNKITKKNKQTKYGIVAWDIIIHFQKKVVKIQREKIVVKNVYVIDLWVRKDFLMQKVMAVQFLISYFNCNENKTNRWNSSRSMLNVFKRIARKKMCLLSVGETKKRFDDAMPKNSAKKKSRLRFQYLANESIKYPLWLWH